LVVPCGTDKAVNSDALWLHGQATASLVESNGSAGFATEAKNYQFVSPADAHS